MASPDAKGVEGGTEKMEFRMPIYCGILISYFMDYMLNTSTTIYSIFFLLVPLVRVVCVSVAWTLSPNSPRFCKKKWARQRVEGKKTTLESIGYRRYRHMKILVHSLASKFPQKTDDSSLRFRLRLVSDHFSQPSGWYLDVGSEDVKNKWWMLNDAELLVSFCLIKMISNVLDKIMDKDMLFWFHVARLTGTQTNSAHH